VFLLEPITNVLHAVGMSAQFSTAEIRPGGGIFPRPADPRHRSATRLRKLLRLLGMVGILIVSGDGRAADNVLPPPPGPGDFLHDLSGVLAADDKAALRDRQAVTFEQHGIPIVVVMIDRIADHAAPSTTIESLATSWFDHWGIGSPERNLGMLVLLAVEDREVRIELGAGWGRRADAEATRIVERSMVPQFRQGNYARGLLAAVSELQALAAAGPDGLPPTTGTLVETDPQAMLDTAMRRMITYNPLAERFGQWAVTLALLAGLGCLAAAVWQPHHRKAWLLTGLGLIILAVFFWLLILALALFLHPRRWAGGGSSGGGFSGGSSGGGGATGRW